MNAKIKLENHDAQEIKYTTCYMCACRCGIKVTMEDNKVRFIQGNRNHPTNQGVLCAKGSAGIMKQYSTAKLTQAVDAEARHRARRGRFTNRYQWDQALDLLTDRLEDIRATDPSKLAFFTGRDQMQALTGLWAQQFGTPNWAAHGGFCSVNMAAAGLYSIGFSFWEFGAPDWDYAKYFLHVGRGGRPFVQPDQDRPGKTQAPRRQVRHRSIRCAPAIRRLPTNGCRSSPAWTACSPCRWCTCC